MGSVKSSLLAGAAATMISTVAMAADLPAIAPPLKAPPLVEDVGSGWYLRGDIGFSNQQIKSLTNSADNAPGITNTNVGMAFDSAPVGDIGIGYQWNDWLRFDVTGQYRGSANFHGSDNWVWNGAPWGVSNLYGTNNYSASKSEWLFLANAYVDLGTWWCITPFIGAGVGTARVSIANFRDDSVSNTLNGNAVGSAFIGDGSTWNFAWAFHAGVAYRVTPAVTLELAYHYVNMGNGVSGLPRAFDNTPQPNVGPFTFNTITSQDFTLGVRWMFDNPPQPLPEVPLMRRG